jgi:hypothetical protein
VLYLDNVKLNVWGEMDGRVTAQVQGKIVAGEEVYILALVRG